jgi:hypothetical protein
VRQPFASYLFALVLLGGVAIVLRGDGRVTAQPVRPPRPPAVGTPADFGKRLSPLPTADPNVVPVRPVYPPPEPPAPAPEERATGVPPVDEWVRYSDPRIQVAFEYPVNWSTQTVADVNSFRIDLRNYEARPGGVGRQLFKAEIYVTPAGLAGFLSLDDFVARRLPASFPVHEREVVEIAGYRAYREVRSGGEANTQIMYYIVAVRSDTLVFTIYDPELMYGALVDRLIASVQIHVK